jgi:hypothetical protein
MIQTRYISRSIKVEIEIEEKSNKEEAKIRMIKGNEEIALTLQEIISISNCDLEFLVDSALYDIECAKEMAE